MQQTDVFVAERPRLVGLATKILADASEAEDVVQQAWLRLHGSDAEIDDLSAWLTTVTGRLCLDRLRRRTPIPTLMDEDGPQPPDTATDPAHEIELGDTVGAALQVVLERLTPAERVAFVLHDSFGFEFSTIAAVLDTTPVASRKLASRARRECGSRCRAAGPLTGKWSTPSLLPRGRVTSRGCSGCWHRMRT